MGLPEMKAAMEETHSTLVGLYVRLKDMLAAEMAPDSMSVRDEVWRGTQHVLRAALIADNISRFVEAKRRRIELESSWFFPDPYEADPLAIESQPTTETSALVSGADVVTKPFDAS